MSATNIRALKNRHQGATIYVVASGASLDYLDPQFFAGKIVVVVNEVWRHVPTSYVVMHHQERAQLAIDAGVRVVTSEIDWGIPGWGRPCSLTGDFYTYKTAENTRDGHPRIDVALLQADTTDALVVSPSSTSEMLQFAAHLGAATIICCGIDEAALDGQWNVTGYCGGWYRQEDLQHSQGQHCRLTHQIMLQTLQALRAKGVRVYALSPFVGAEHEGHVYTQPPVLTGHDLAVALRDPKWRFEDPCLRA
jgi:hypothetical protein